MKAIHDEMQADDFDPLSDLLSDEDDLFVEGEESEDSKMDRDLLGIVTVTDVL